MFTGPFTGFEHIVIALCIAYILNRLVNKSKKAEAIDERIAQLESGKMETWDEYLAKLCRITGKNASQLMTIAAQESGLNLGPDRISKDFGTFMRDGDLPHYVIRFLKNGKEQIDSIDEGEGRPKPGWPLF